MYEVRGVTIRRLSARCAWEMKQYVVRSSGRAGRPAEGHPAGFPGCPLLMERVVRLRARTNYGPPKVKERGGFGVGQMVDERGEKKSSGGSGEQPSTGADERRLLSDKNTEDCWTSKGAKKNTRGAKETLVNVLFLQVNLDHTRLATTNLFHHMTELGVSLAAVSDPYRPGKKLPSPPPGFQYIAVERDPVVAIIMQRAPFDICPLLVSELVVAIYCEANDTDFVFISAYAPPHKSMEPTLVLVERVLTRWQTRNIIVAGDFNAKTSAWGAQASDTRGSRLVEFAAATGLVLLNDSS
ncbi:hypothetical protein MRX96_005047 [Rhipicephalus microplus]